MTRTAPAAGAAVSAVSAGASLAAGVSVAAGASLGAGVSVAAGVSLAAGAAVQPVSAASSSAAAHRRDNSFLFIAKDLSFPFLLGAGAQSPPPYWTLPRGLAPVNPLARSN